MTQSNLTFTEGHEIPEGCKNTELGIFPEPWKLMTIQEALDTKYLLDQMDGNHGELYPRSNEFSQSGIAYIGATDFSDNKVDFKNCKFLPLIRAKKFRKGIAKSGDVLFAHNATVGPAALLKTDDEFVILSTTATYYRCNDKHLSNQYLLSFFESNAFKQQYTAVMSQSTRNQVSILAQRKFKLVLPSREEQEKIATALSDTDALISELEKLIEKKQAIKTATMQQLLTGKTRLPEFALREDGTPKGYKDSELGQIPEDWGIFEINEVVENIIDYRGRTPRKLGMDWGGGNIVALSAGNVKKGYIDFDAECYLGSELLYKKWMRNGEAQKDDIAFTMEAPLGNVALIPDYSKYILSQRTILLQINRQEFDPHFVFHVLMSNEFEKYISDQATGSTAQGIKRSLFEKLKLVLPIKLAEQKSISQILDDFDFEIEKLNQKLNKLQLIKQGMMQELLTGKTRLV